MDQQRDTRFVELGEYLCEVRACQHWRLEKFDSFDAFLESRFPGSRRKAYYLMAIHEHLPAKVKSSLKAVGWSKAVELMRVARSDGERFASATWLHMAQHLPKEQFKHEVERHLSGKDVEPSEIIYFKFFKSQIPVVEQALEMASRMLGSDKPRGYCLEMICADFLAGASLDHDPNTLLVSVSRLVQLLPEPQKLEFLRRVQALAQGDRRMTPHRAGPQARGEAAHLRLKILERDNWRCQFCGCRSNLQVHHVVFRSHGGPESERNLITVCVACHNGIHRTR